MPKIKKIGVLTGGGDAPGLNAVIRAVVKAASNAGVEVIGLEDSFDGLIYPEKSRPLTPREVDVIRAIAEGLTTAEAAAHLGLAPDTVQGVLRGIFIKLKLKNRTQLVRWAFLNGLAQV